MIVIFSISAVLLLIWLGAFVYQNDFSLPSKDYKRHRNILIIFPHPDDEVLTTGGFIHSLNNSLIKTTCAVMTVGEAGECYVKNMSDLGALRILEMKKSAKVLGVKNLIQLNLGDGRLQENRKRVELEVGKILKEIKPDLVITYDLAGLYGHSDHIVLSEIITSLRKKYNYDLWYSSFPKHTISMIHLPEHMAHDSEFKRRRKFPTHKIFIGLSVLPKIQALYTHRSQYMSFRSAYPFRFVPLWFFVSGTLYEYFHEV